MSNVFSVYVQYIEVRITVKSKVKRWQILKKQIEKVRNLNEY